MLSGQGDGCEARGLRASAADFPCVPRDIGSPCCIQAFSVMFGWWDNVRTLSAHLQPRGYVCLQDHLHPRISESCSAHGRGRSRGRRSQWSSWLPGSEPWELSQSLVTPTLASSHPCKWLDLRHVIIGASPTPALHVSRRISETGFIFPCLLCSSQDWAQGRETSQEPRVLGRGLVATETKAKEGRDSKLWVLEEELSGGCGRHSDTSKAEAGLWCRHCDPQIITLLYLVGLPSAMAAGGQGL